MHLPLPLAFAACALPLGLGACGSSRDPVDNKADGAALPEPKQDLAANPAGAPPANEAALGNVSAPPSGVSVPAALHGRWGLAPGDCTSNRGDAKGLLVIGERELRFYESRAVPAAGVQANADSISGTFDFTGEGERWSKYEALKLDGTKLIRTETNPAASFTYAKC